MKKLTPKQMFELVDFLTDCEQDYEDSYSINAINRTLKVLDYEGEFNYVPDENAFKFDGVLEN
jgi:hypothetical protein